MVNDLAYNDAKIKYLSLVLSTSAVIDSKDQPETSGRSGMGSQHRLQALPHTL